MTPAQWTLACMAAAPFVLPLLALALVGVAWLAIKVAAWSMLGARAAWSIILGRSLL